MEDAAIILKYENRDESAIYESDKKYGAYCRAIAYRILFDALDSDECVNDTWLSAWNAIPPKKPNILRVFFGKITRNLAINRYEAKNAQKRGGGETAAVLDELEGVVSGGDVESEIENIALKEALDNFLSTLADDARRIFVARYWYMYSVKDIAKGFSMGESRVKMTLLRTRNALREYLEKEGIEV